MSRIALVVLFGFSAAFAASSQPQQSQTLNIGLWRVDKSFQSTLRIKNGSAVNPYTVTPALFMQDGTEYDLPPVQLAINGIGSVNLNDAVAAAAQTLGARTSQVGSAVLRFNAPAASILSGTLEILDIANSLSYVTGCSAAGGGETSPQVLEALWWRHDPGVGGFVALTNTTSHAVNVNYQVMGRSGHGLPTESVTLPAHNTTMLDLPTLWSALTEPDNSAGGIRVTYTGAAGDVLALGGLENDGEGYSATVRFSSPLPKPAHGNANPKPHTQTYAAVGLLMGSPMNELGFPVGTSFQIYTALRNTTSRPMGVAMTANYMNGDAASSVPLPTVQLSPYESQYLDMPGVLSKAGLGNFSGC